VGACVAEFVEYGMSLPPGLAGPRRPAGGSLGVPELEQDGGFGAPVTDLAEDRLCVAGIPPA
jgi:hypothetical protein